MPHYMLIPSCAYFIAYLQALNGHWGVKHLMVAKVSRACLQKALWGGAIRGSADTSLAMTVNGKDHNCHAQNAIPTHCLPSAVLKIEGETGCNMHNECFK